MTIVGTDFKAEVEKMLADVVQNAERQPIFLKVGGSHSHNTAMPESDVDYIGVFKDSNERLLSLRPPRDTIDRKDPDTTMHEAAKFSRLLLKGNPGIIECLFTERMYACHGTLWAAIRDQRESFLTVQTVNQYTGYAQSQLRKLKKGTGLHTKGGKYNTKWAYHLIRLTNDAMRIIIGNPPVVWKEGDEREQLLAIRRGDFEPDEIEKLALSSLEFIDKAISSSRNPIPKENDIGIVEDWLKLVRDLR